MKGGAPRVGGPRVLGTPVFGGVPLENDRRVHVSCTADRNASLLSGSVSMSLGGEASISFLPPARCQLQELVERAGEHPRTEMQFGRIH